MEKGPLKLKFLGASDTVTGSRTLLSHGGKNILVDCGLFQGPKDVRQRNWQAFPFDPTKLDAVVLTHAHLDHSGYLPRLVAQGFSGPIYASKGTHELCQVLLHDAAYLEEEFARYANKSGYSNHRPALPLFTREDVEKTLMLFQPCERQEWVEMGGEVFIRFLRAGHIPGASMVQVSLAGMKPRRLIFSGDLGIDRMLTMRCPEKLPESEVLVLESTYGARLQEREPVMPRLAEIIRQTARRNGVVVIPAFAVGRAQEIIYQIKTLEDKGEIPILPVVLDSPMAIQATRTFLSHPEDHRLDFKVSSFEENFKPKKFETCVSADESMLCTMRDGPMIVISAAGMLNGGRILHHLKRRLPDRKNTIVFAGYQAEGTKGRYLQDIAGKQGVIRIHHQDVEVHAQIETLTGLSSHMDYQDILGYLDQVTVLPKLVLLNHGSPSSQAFLAEAIQSRFGIKVICSHKSKELRPFSEIQSDQVLVGVC